MASADPNKAGLLSAADRYGRSLANRRTENDGMALLLGDPRFQAVDAETKRQIVDTLGFASKGRYGPRTFDLVMTPEPVEPLTPRTVDRHLGALRLVEMKTSRKAIADASLSGFFFGATQNEYELAELLGSRYVFAFVVLNDRNTFGRPFAVLLTLDQVEARTRVRRVQYQVNFGVVPAEAPVEVVVLGSAGEL